MNIFGINSIAKIFMLLFFLIFNFNSQNREIKKDSVQVITIAFVGDLMCHSEQFQYAAVPGQKDSFDFNNNYYFVKDYLSKTDFTIGNFESVTAGKKSVYTGYPLFNTPIDYLQAVKNAGFDFLMTSNNHSYDRSKIGVLKTINALDSLNLGRTGTYKSQIDRDSIRIVSVKGIKIALLAYTYGLNGHILKKGEEYLANLIDTVLIKNDIETAKSFNPDIVLTYLHFGNEYERLPSKFQKLIVEKTILYGSDIIIGSHPHVLQPIEYFKGNNNLDSGFVAYSLGNFISNQRKRYTDGGAIIKFTIAKTSKEVSLAGVEYLPTWVFKGTYLDKRSYLILPNNSSEKYKEFDFLTVEDHVNMKRSFLDANEIINKYSNKHQIIK